MIVVVNLHFKLSLKDQKHNFNRRFANLVKLSKDQRNQIETFDLLNYHLHISLIFNQNYLSIALHILDFCQNRHSHKLKAIKGINSKVSLAVIDFAMLNHMLDQNTLIVDVNSKTWAVEYLAVVSYLRRIPALNFDFIKAFQKQVNFD